jgi:hypothetical protein
VAADAEIVLIAQEFPNPEAKAELARMTDTMISYAPSVTA